MSTTSLHCLLPSLGHPTPLLHPTSHWNRGVNLGLTHGWVGWDGIYQRVTLRPAPISPLSSLPSLTTVNDYTIQTSTKRLNISLVSNSITIFLFSSVPASASVLYCIDSTQLDRRDELVYAANPTISSTPPFFHDNNSTQLNSL